MNETDTPLGTRIESDDIDTDPGRRALAKGLISFAHDIGSSITAEGVETRGELQMLRSLGVDKVQGYYLSKPLPLEEALSAARGACPPLPGGRNSDAADDQRRPVRPPTPMA